MVFSAVMTAVVAGVAASSQDFSDIPWQCDCDQTDVHDDGSATARCKQNIDIAECTRLIKIAEAVGFKDFPMDLGMDPRTTATIGSLSSWPGVNQGYGLSWSGLGLQGTIPSLLGEVPWMQNVNLYNNNLTGPIPNIPSAKELYLGQNMLSGGFPSGSWPELWRMFLTDNQLTGSLPQGLDKSMPKLRRLDIRNNRFTGEIPSDMSIWKPSIACDMCEFGGNQWSSPIPSWFNATNTICCRDLHCFDNIVV